MKNIGVSRGHDLVMGVPLQLHASATDQRLCERARMHADCVCVCERVSVCVCVCVCVCLCCSDYVTLREKSLLLAPTVACRRAKRPGGTSSRRQDTSGAPCALSPRPSHMHAHTCEPRFRVTQRYTQPCCNEAPVWCARLRACGVTLSRACERAVHGMSTRQSIGPQSTDSRHKLGTATASLW